MDKFVPGQEIMFYETPCIFLEEREEGLFVIAKERIKTVFGDNNNFAGSDLASFLNGKYLNELACENNGYIVTRDVDLTALDGSKEYGHYECKVAPLTFDEIRRLRNLLPKPKSWEWSATSWNTPCVDENDIWIATLGANGGINSACCTNAYGTRPAFIISYKYFENNKKDLSQYSDVELINELYKRHSKT